MSLRVCNRLSVKAANLFCVRPSAQVNRKITAILMVLLFYSVAGLLFTLLCVKMFSNGKTLVASLPSVYANYAEPRVTEFSEALNSTCAPSENLVTTYSAYLA